MIRERNDSAAFAPPELKLLVDERHTVLAGLADRWWMRTRGLRFRRPLSRGEGLLLSPCSSVHTCLMRRPIDVVYLDGDLRVVKTASRVRPWRFSFCRRACYTLELAAGEIARLDLSRGSRLTVHPAQRLG